MDPLPPKKVFGQCGTCMHFAANDERCVLFGPTIKVDADDSCGLYVHGAPALATGVVKHATPEEAGFVQDHPVRCKNCMYFDAPGSCGLYKKLNAAMPDYFDLVEKVQPKGCCNAHMPLMPTTVTKDGPTVGDVHVPSALGNISVGYTQLDDASQNGKKRKKTKKRYASVAELPSAVKDKLSSPKRRRQWMHVWNSSYDRHGDEGRAFAEAWSATRKHWSGEMAQAILPYLEPTEILKALDALEAPPMVGVGGRTLEPFDADTLFTPLRYDPNGLAYLRADQVPRFLDAVTHPKRLPKAKVAIKDLTAIKSRVARQTVETHLNKLNAKGKVKPPVVLRMNGGLYAGDGHDRLAALWLNGDDDTTVRYIDIEPYDYRKPDPDTEHDGSRFDLLQGAQDRVLANYRNGTLAVPFRYDSAFFAYLRPDQVPKFMHGITHGDDLPETTIPLNDLIAIQDRVNADTVAAHVENPSDDLPIVIRLEGNRNYIGDGHDRLTARWLTGDNTARVKLKDLSGPATNTMKLAPRSLSFKIVKVAPDLKQIFGWASVVTKDGKLITDKQNDQIEPAELEKAVYDYVVNSRDMGLMHMVKGMGNMIESCMFTLEKQRAMGISLPHEAWWVGYQVTDDAVWKAVRDGSLMEFSIGGYAVSNTMDA